jgi:alkanesulfonate monooxygenase SsuD/methylene tetrahydromethanopterin reductase-like flavin-dependent oxidoreductase (luciferase family)
VMAGALTQRVRRAKIALLGATIPILDPVRVAEELAMLDVMTGGRVVAGMLRGTPNEYVTYNTNPAETRDRFQESLKLIVRAWTEPQPFGWEGRHYQYRSISIWPRPIQAPHPPIYMSGSSPESGEFAARNRLSLGFAVTTIPLAREAARHYRQQAAEAGWEPTQDNILYRLTAHLAETDEQAMEDLHQPGAIENYRVSSINTAVAEAVFASGYHGRDAERQHARIGRRTLEDRIELGQLLAGSPETVFKQVRSIRDELGAGILDLSFLPVGREKALRAIELFGTRVLPRMRDI